MKYFLNCLLMIFLIKRGVITNIECFVNYGTNMCAYLLFYNN